jgi:hypothetical protein
MPYGLLGRPTPVPMPADFILGADVDATNYISRVEAADEQTLELSVRLAINAFVRSCKADGTWNAIKASCILAGARTLSGALVPLAGAAPTSFNFVSADYDRKAGLKADGSTKYLNSNRNATADPQDNTHISVYISSTPIGNVNNIFLASGDFLTNGSSSLQTSTSNTLMQSRSRNTTGAIHSSLIAGFFGLRRQQSLSYDYRLSGATGNILSTSQTPVNDFYFVFRGNVATPNFSNARLAFYSIGEALDLALLDARVTTLINAISAAL